MPSTQLSITLPSEICEQLKADATENYRTLSAEIAFICAQYFKHKESENE